MPLVPSAFCVLGTLNALVLNARCLWCPRCFTLDSVDALVPWCFDAHGATEPQCHRCLDAPCISAFGALGAPEPRYFAALCAWTLPASVIQSLDASVLWGIGAPCSRKAKDISDLKSQMAQVLEYLVRLFPMLPQLCLYHMAIVTEHLARLGLTLNKAKSQLIPVQSTVYLGLRLHSLTMQAYLLDDRVAAIHNCLALFQQGSTVQLLLCQKLCGLMAAASSAIQLGLLHMHPI
ncbi:UNVERIFIED_CONTAM: hypothetical protein FKN15_068059 [Acipenser sinensis]